MRKRNLPAVRHYLVDGASQYDLFFDEVTIFQALLIMGHLSCLSGIIIDKFIHLKKMKKLVLYISLLCLFAILILSFTASSTAETVYYQIANRESMLDIVIVDEEAKPFPGAAVRLVELNKDTITNADGITALKISQHSCIMVVSFIGYQSKVIRVIRGNTTPYRVALYPERLTKK